jgi:hypothetical protein
VVVRELYRDELKPGLLSGADDGHNGRPIMTTVNPMLSEFLPSTCDAFMREVQDRRIEIYNEFSLQHELGIFLRGRLPDFWKSEFERPSTHFGISAKLTKKEIDITLVSSKAEAPIAIELKFPRAGQVPEQMFSTLKDVRFVEQLAEHGFAGGVAIIVAEDSLFWRGRDIDGIYAPFRNGLPAHGRIQKPTGKRDEWVELSGSYEIEWRGHQAGLRYALIQVP